jgi:hypothetical protein
MGAIHGLNTFPGLGWVKSTSGLDWGGFHESEGGVDWARKGRQFVLGFVDFCGFVLTC